MRESLNLRINRIRNGCEVEISDVNHGGERNWTGAHAAIAPDTHVNLKLYLFLSKRFQIAAMLDSHNQWLFFRLHLHTFPASSYKGAPQLVQKCARRLTSAPQ